MTAIDGERLRALERAAAEEAEWSRARVRALAEGLRLAEGRLAAAEHRLPPPDMEPSSGPLGFVMGPRGVPVRAVPAAEWLDRTVEVDTALGPLLMHADDDTMTPIIQRERAWEPGESAFLRAAGRPGGLAVDVGANVGYLTLVLAEVLGPSGRVLAVEPEPANARLLIANLWLHEVGNVEVLPAAAMDRTGFVGLSVNNANRGDHRVDADGGMRVPAVRLDAILEDAVDLVKIDVQGREHLVLEGMRETLARSPDPIILVEYWPLGIEDAGHDPQGVLDGYRELGMAVEVLDEEGRRRPPPRALPEYAHAAPSQYVNLVLSRA